MNFKLSLLLLVPLATTAMASEFTSKRPNANILTQMVLGQAELAKIKNLDILKEKEKEKLAHELTTIKKRLDVLNDSVTDHFKAVKSKEMRLITRLKKERGLSSRLVDSFKWAEERLTYSKDNEYFNLVSNQAGELNQSIDLSKKLAMNLSESISMMELNIKLMEKERLNTSKKKMAELSKMKDDELLSEIENKLMFGSYEFNIYYLTADSKPIKEQAELIERIFKSLSNYKTDISVEIIGRADPRGGYEYNADLAEKRALTIKDIALKAGIDEKMIQHSSFVSKGEVQDNRELHFFDRNTTVTIYKNK